MTIKRTLGLIEPCYYGLGFVDAAFEAGYRIISIVSDKGNPQKYGYEGKYYDLIQADIRDADAIIKAIKSSPYNGKFDAILAANDYVSAIAAKVSEAFATKHIPYSAIIKARLKDETRKTIQNSNLPNAKFADITNLEEAQEAAKNIGYPVILKPTDGACSQNVFLVKNQNELVKAFGKVSGLGESYLNFKVRKKFLIEEYISGEEFSVEIFMLNGKAAFSSVTEKIKGEPPFFAEIAHIVPTSVHTDKIGILTKAAEDYMNVLGLEDGCSHVEMRLSPKGPIVMEINPRPGGDQIARDLLINAFGVNLFSAVIDWHVGNTIDVKPKKHCASAIAFLTANKIGYVKAISGIEDASNSSGIVQCLIKAKIGDPVKPPESSDDRYGYVISVGNTPIEAKQATYEALAKIKFEIE
jgi:biotin carboxylase